MSVQTSRYDVRAKPFGAFQVMHSLGIDHACRGRQAPRQTPRFAWQQSAPNVCTPILAQEDPSGLWNADPVDGCEYRRHRRIGLAVNCRITALGSSS